MSADAFREAAPPPADGRGDLSAPRSPAPEAVSLARWIPNYVGEVLGTFLLVLFGCSAVTIAVIYGQGADLFLAGLAWGSSVALAIWVTGSLSGTHINPAVTLGFAAAGRFPWRQVLPYWGCQILGGFVGAATVVLVFGDAIRQFAQDQNLTFGGPGSERIAMMLSPYSPHPWIVGTGVEAYAIVPVWRGFLTEAVATAVLVLVVFALLESASDNAPASWGFPLPILFLITMLTVVTAAHTMTSLNPARDLGPRLMLALMGFGDVAFPGTRGGMSLLVTSGGPLVGGTVGALTYQHLLHPLFEQAARARSATQALITADAALIQDEG